MLRRLSGRVTRTLVPPRYRIRSVGRGSRIVRSTRVHGGNFIAIGDGVTIAGLGWLIVPGAESRPPQTEPVIQIDSGTSIGESCTISGVNHIRIGANVLFGPRVWVTDHNHVYTDPERPIQHQGWTRGGAVEIEENCWVGTGAVIVGSQPVRIGRGSVIGANSVVTEDVPDHSVVAGNPARVVREYDPASARWRSAGAADR
ncbi:MAG TPA: acyltransferase [Candidatus Dormibacteraeota bacterium]